MDREHVQMPMEQAIAVYGQRRDECVLVGFQSLDHDDRQAASDGLPGPLQHLQLHAFDIDLDQVEPRQIEGIDRERADLGQCGRTVVDRLADEFVAFGLFQFEAAEASGRQVIRGGNAHRPVGRRGRGEDGARVEAVVERDIAGQRVEDALLRLDRDHRAPTGHRPRPFQRVHADIGAAVDRDHPVAEMRSPCREQARCDTDLEWFVDGVDQQLVADPVSAFAGAVVVKSIENHRAVLGRGQHEADLPGRVGHHHGPFCRRAA